MINKILVLFFLLLTFACSKQTENKTAVIRGVIQGHLGETLYFSELRTHSLIPLDSAKIDERGQFIFKTVPSEKGFYLLKTTTSEPIALVLDTYDTLDVMIDSTGFDLGYTLNGNEESRLLRAYHEKTRNTKTKIEALKKIRSDSRPMEQYYKIKAETDSSISACLLEHKNFADSLIRNNAGSLASLLIANQIFAGKPLFEINKYTGLHLLLDSTLMEKIPGNSHVTNHNARVNRFLQQQADQQKAISRLSPGQVIPDISLPDAEGKKQRLAAHRGKYVIVFFWASWSPESRADIQLLKNLYDNFDREDLEVYAVSLDHKEKFWRAALEIEGLAWTNVSDPSGLGGPVAGLFNLPQKLPYYFLIDKKGVIVEKTDGFSEIKKKLEKITGCASTSPVL
jgi:peroxiredoxin